MDIEKRKKLNEIKITERDLNILEFIGDMKFSDLDSIYQKFFSQTKLGTSKSNWWARERMGLLKKHGLISSVRILFSSDSYFLVTELGYKVLCQMRPSESFVRPLLEIDIRTFEHDRCVLTSRLALEKSGRALKWMSERRLKSESAFLKGLPRQYQPDAIYWNKFGEPVAFELENSEKTKSRYEKKVRKYVEIMRDFEKTDQFFKRTLFVVRKNSVNKQLTEMTSRYQGLFLVTSFEELVGSKEPKKADATVKAKTQNSTKSEGTTHVGE